MRWLIINDLYVRGGAEIQSLRELRYWKKMGHETLYVTIDPDLGFGQSCEEGHINIAAKGAIFRDAYRFIFERRVYRELTRILERFSPDCVHLNNVYLSAKAVFLSVKNYKCIQTVRDFSIICTKATCIFSNHEICKGWKYENCFKQCFPSTVLEIPRFMARYVAMRVNNDLRLKSVNAFISPSLCLTNYCRQHGFHALHIPNPVADELVAMNPEKKVVDNRIFLYYGEVSEIKGVKVLIEAFKNFSSRYANAELHIVGHLKGISDEDMRASIEGYPISYLGPMPYNEMIEKLDSVYAVVVPSIWQENYPNTVLESISRMKMVIGSDRGGIPELISNSDYIFVANDIDCLTVSMGKVYSLSDKAYANECRSVYEKVVISNSQSKYYDRVIRLAKSI